MEQILRFTERLIPKPIYRFGQPIYHETLAFAGAVIYRFPSRKIKVIGVTGTKGKSSTVELVSAILEEAGYKTALLNTIRFKIGDQSENNMYKMSMPGRAFVQRFMRRAVNAQCDYVILEMTSQGFLQRRHKYIDLDGFIFTNISPEHIESHGSYENYLEAKLSLAKGLAKSSSPKHPRILVVNGDDKEAERFLQIPLDRPNDIKKTFKLKDAEPYTVGSGGIDFTFRGDDANTETKIHSPLSGIFNLSNILAAATMTNALGVDNKTISRAIGTFAGIRGRVEKIEADESVRNKQDFSVIVDYAHTPDSLRKLYEVFETKDGKDIRKICVLGGTGGGRDRWKRKEMGNIAAEHCDYIVLTNEDPYDEDPMTIINDVKEGVLEGLNEKTGTNDQNARTTTSAALTVLLDRREAIRDAIAHARAGDVVLVSGKGTDPYIMGRRGHNTPWSDAQVAKEELTRFLQTRQSRS